MAHINLTREADAILVAPCSADFIAKLVHGRADDLLSPDVPGAADRPLPAAGRAGDEPRDVGASGHAAQPGAAAPPTARTMLGVGSGDQACGEIGDGRMLEPAELLEDLIAFFQPKLLAGKRVLVTAGPTFEPIDPVRGITNLSSGKMGFAIARAAREAGAEVTLVAGPVQPADAARRARASTCNRRSRCSTRCWPQRRRPTSSSPPPRSPTGGPPTPSTRRSRRTARQGAPSFELDREPRHPRRRRARAARSRRRSASASPPRATTCSSTRRPSASARACR